MAWRLSGGMLGCALVAAACTACESPFSDTHVAAFEVGEDVDLEAAVAFDQLYAVGSTFVVTDGGATRNLGNRLHDIELFWSQQTAVVVVGDDGFVAVAAFDDQAGLGPFTTQPTDFTADLVAVAGDWTDTDELKVVVVGDELLAIGVRGSRLGTLDWTVQDAPAGGWGVLRDVRYDSGEVCALGDAGALFCADFQNLEWQRVELDTDEDLTQFCHGGLWSAVGANGTFVMIEPWDIFEWSTGSLGSVDLVACSHSIKPGTPIVVGANQTVYEAWGTLRVMDRLDWQPLAFERGFGRHLVGERGHVGAFEGGLQF